MPLSLNTSERIGMLVMLRSITHASLSELRAVKRTIKNLEITEEEKTEVEMRMNPQNGQLMWNTDKGATKKAFEIEDRIIDILTKQLVQMDKANKIPNDDALIAIAELLLPATGAEKEE